MNALKDEEKRCGKKSYKKIPQLIRQSFPITLKSAAAAETVEDYFGNMEKIRFLFYYIKLRLSAGLGIRKTPDPLDIRRRWNHWQNIKAARRKRN